MNANDESKMERDRSGQPVAPEVIRLEQEIAQTRANMSGTMNELESRLSPAEVREKLGVELQHVEERVRLVVREQLAEAKTLVETELSQAKSLLRDEMNEAEDKIKRGLGEARQALKNDVKEALTGAKHAVRAATLGQVEDLATTIGDKMNDTRDTLVATVRENPIPAALVGVGLVWLLMNRGRSAQNGARGRVDEDGGAGRLAARFGDTLGSAGSTVNRLAHDVTDAAGERLHQVADAAGSAAHQAKDATLSLAHQAGDAAGHLADQAGDAASSLAEGAQRNVKRVEQGFSDTLHENPMVLGVAALAVGAVVGFSLPRTGREDALMGEARDRLLSHAGDAAHEAASSVTELAEHALENLKNPSASGLTASE